MKPYMRKWERSEKIRNLMILRNGHIIARFSAPSKYTKMNTIWVSHAFPKKGDSFDGTSLIFHFILSFLCVWFLWCECVFFSLNMGGEPRKQEPKNCDVWKAKKEVWKILQNGNVTGFLERLNEFKPHITTVFFKNWSNDKVSLHGVTVKLTKEFIAEITGLPTTGIKFTKQTSISNAAFKKFPKTVVEEKQLEKSGDFFNLHQIKEIWRDVLCCIREYFILDGRSKRVHKCHFVFLNHFRHKDRISFPFYLRYSLLHSLEAHKKKDSRPILHEGLILLIEGYCKNQRIASTPSKDKKQGSIKGRKDISIKGKEKALNLETAVTQKLVDYESETEKMDCPENTNPEDEDDTDADDLISNLDGYPDSEGNIEKGNEDTNSEGNTEQSKTDIQGDQAISREKEDHSAKTVSPIIGEEKRKEPVLNDDSTGAPQEGQMEMEKNNDNVSSPHHETAVNDTDSLQRGTTLTFLDSAKTKADTMLKVDSWIYNEIMGLKKKVDTLLQNQASINAKISNLDGPMGDIPDKLSNYEHKLKLLIKESGTKMDQVTATICAAVASLGKRENEGITVA
jgi:hypothetical protein